MPFHGGQLAVFNRTGARVGTLTNVTISSARTFRFNEIEDMSFYMPRDGYTASVKALLADDNIVYIENELPGMVGWAGVISNHEDADDRVSVTTLGALSLYGDLDTTTVKQSEGTSSSIASRLVGAASAKQGAHGDLVPTLVVDGDTDMPGIWEYEGDILQGLQRLASDGLAEMYVEAILSDDAQRLSLRLHWNATTVSVDHSDVVLKDGAGGVVKSSPSLLYSGLEVINHAKLKGQQTDLGQYVDYSSVRSIIRDITPEIEVTLDDGPTTYRRREDLSLSVSFGYPESLQRAMAQEIQQRYVDYFKTFLYAFHFRQGKPYLEGFDWGGPDDTNETRLVEDRFRTLNKLGRIGAATIVTADSDMDFETAAITDWSLDARTNPIDMGDITGVALDYADTSQHYISDSTGRVSTVASDDLATTFWGTIPVGGGTLVGIATDVGSINTLWAAIKNGTTVTIRWYDVNSVALIGQYSFTAAGAGDIAVDFEQGLLYIATSVSGGQIQVRDLASGSLLSPDKSFASGFSAPVGLTVSGGLAYVAGSTGLVRMLYVDDGSFAGDFATNVPISGAMYADVTNRRIYLSHGGDLSVYNAYVAVATVSGPGAPDGAPGFDNILSGAFVHIVETSDGAYSPKHTATSSAAYTVKGGDTLWDIAKRYYGSGSSWPTIYRANKSTIDATALAHGFTTDYPHWIFPGEHLTIPGPGGQSDPDPPKPSTKYLIVYTPGHWVTQIVPGPVNEPAILQRSWEDTHPQVVGFVSSSTCKPQGPKVIIQGEEGRVDDWDPSRDGYGVYRHVQRYRTTKGHIDEEGPGWYPADWDVPESEWTIDQQPWPKGEQYLADYLKKRNRQVTVRSFRITNVNGDWSKMRRGALFTLSIEHQGPIDAPTTNVIRVLAFGPSEMAGEMEIVAEVWP